MFEMNLFSENESQTLLKELASYQVDTYGNANMLKVFQYVKSQGWFGTDSEIFSKLRKMAADYDMQHVQDNMSCVLLSPLADYVDTNPSEEDLNMFFDLDFEAKRFVLKFPSIIPDLKDVYELSKAGLFSAMSGEACLLAIDCYGVETLKNGKYNKANASIEILLKTWSEYRCGMPLEEMIKYSEKISAKQALVLDILIQVGFTLEKLVEEFSSLEKLLLCLDIIYAISMNKVGTTPEDFGMLLHYMYLQFDEEELKILSSMNRGSCSSIYMYGMFKSFLNDQNYSNIRNDLSRLQYIPEEFSSVEIVVDGVSKMIIPVDASIDSSLRDMLQTVFAGVRFMASQLVHGEKDNKVVIYICKAVDRLVMVGERNFNFSLYIDDEMMNGGISDEFDPGGLWDTLFNSLANNECMFDMRMFEFFKANTDDYISNYAKYLNQSVDMRITMYLASRSCCAGNTEYLQLLKRDDQGVPLFKTLATFMRPDDSFYAAMLRYQLAILKVPFTVYNWKLDVGEEIQLGDKSFNVMNILAGDKSLLMYLQGCDVEKVIADLR